MNYRSLGLSLLVLFGLQTAVLASDPPATHISYREGRSVVYRDGRRLWDPVEFGFPLEDFDFIRNDHESLVEVRTERTTGSAVITAGPDTTFSLDLAPFGYEQRGVLELMTGAVSLTVDLAPGASELAGKSGFTVRTERVVIDAEFATFDVILSPRGDVLILTRDGLVACRKVDGRVLFSRPGLVVELNVDGSFRNIPVAIGGLEEFKRRWTADRTAALRADFEQVVGVYADRYERLRDSFEEQYAALFSRRDILDVWMRESAQGRIGSATDVDREKNDKSELSAYLSDIRPTFSLFEKVYYRVLELRSFASDGSAGGAGTATRSTLDFFRAVDVDRRVLEQRMSNVRHVLKMYAQRNDRPVAH
ncbi:MAG: hypothetical protein EA426_06540 [Spirochaetaceae bacterium]|nr:MAG: hypothetical protein EA426_06540 [Spirochaetaceae bacterium]